MTNTANLFATAPMTATREDASIINNTDVNVVFEGHVASPCQPQQPPAAAAKQHPVRPLRQAAARQYSHSPYTFDVVGDSSTGTSSFSSSRAASDVGSDTASSHGIDAAIEPQPQAVLPLIAFVEPPMAIDGPQSFSFADHNSRRTLSFSATTSGSGSRVAGGGRTTPTPALVSPTTSITNESFGSHTQQFAQESRMQAALQQGVDGLPVLAGHIAAVAATAKGSSYLQAMLDKHPQAALPIVFHEVKPEIHRLLLNKFGSYVVKSLLLKLDHAASAELVASLVRDDALLLRLCTSDLHARRVFQFLLTDVQGTKSAMFEFICRHAQLVAFHPEGCVVIQRVLDVCPPQQREDFYEWVVRPALRSFALDAHGSFIVQYMLDSGDARRNAETFMASFGQRFIPSLIAHPHAAKVAERAACRLPAVRFAMLAEITAAGPNGMRAVLQQESGCYVLSAMAREGTDRELAVLSSQVVPVVASDVMRSMPVASRRLADVIARRMVAINRNSVAYPKK